MSLIKYYIINLPLQSMVTGDPGLLGLPAASHAEQEQDLDQEPAAVLRLLVVEKVVQDQAL